MAPPFFSALLYIAAVELINILLIMYLISILQFSNENFSIQNPFSILLGLGIIKVAGELFSPASTGNLLMGISIIYVIILIYVLIASFKIRSQKLSKPFKALGIVWLTVTLIKMSLLFMLNKIDKAYLSLYVDLLNIMPLLATYYILHKTGEILTTMELINVDPLK